MNNKFNLRDLLNTRAKDYTFAISFLLIFSFFIFIIIRPNLATGFGLQKELEDLKKIDQDYDEAIQSIVKVQTVVEKNREFFPLLQQAIPSNPQVNQVIDDLKKVAVKSGIEINKIDIAEVNLKGGDTKNSLKAYIINIGIQADFVKVNAFVLDVLNQRRLKSIKNLSIMKDGQASASAVLNVILEIEGYSL